MMTRNTTDENRSGADLLAELAALKARVAWLESSTLPASMENRYEQLVETSPFGVAIHQNERLVYVNPAAANLLRAGTGDQLVGCHIQQFIHPDELSDAMERARRLHAGGQNLYPQKTRYLRLDGSVLPVEVWVTLLPYDGRMAAQVVFRDITKQQGMEQALLESEQRYRQLVESSPFAIVIHQDNRIVYANPAALDLIGAVSLEEVVGNLVTSFVHPAGLAETQERIKRMLAGESGLYPAEDRYVRLDGRTIDVEIRVTPFSYQGRPAIQVIGSDITDRKRVAETLQAALVEKELLMRELFHRTKNNMQVISSMLALQQGYTTHPQVAQVFRDIEHRIRSMALVHQMLYHTRSLSTIRLDEYVSDLVPQLLHSFQVDPAQIDVRFSLEPVVLNIDAAVPCGLVMNELITNAFQHAFPAGRHGVLDIEIGRPDPDHVLIGVHDNGVGLPPGFSLAAQTDHSFGLLMIKTLVEYQLRGTLMVTHNGGTGTSWTIQFNDDSFRARV
jgi:PAS domain S-box-containing protein